MAQLFSRKSNVLSKTLPIYIGVAPFLVAWVAINTTPWTHATGVAPEQPAPFSHKRHVGDMGFDCRLCHPGVEKTSFAGIPATDTCFMCHSQIWPNSPLVAAVRDSYALNKPIRWNRVNKVPDFVYFDHSIHVNKGVSCFTCHGSVDQMTLTYKEKAFEMRFCLQCHRDPERFVRPLSEIYNSSYVPPGGEEGKKLVKQFDIRKEQLANCSICHR